MQMLTVTTHVSRGRQDSVSEDPSQLEAAKEHKSEEATFPCPSLLQLHTWHHLTVVVNKTLRSRAKVLAYVNSVSIGSEKVARIEKPVFSDTYIGCSWMLYYACTV